MDDAVIRTEKLTKRYKKQTAVSEVSLEVPPGKIFALMGRNGAGKSSLIRMLLGLTPITAGRATVLGLDSAKEHVAIRARVGYVPEAHHMYRWMTIGEVVRFTASFYPTWNEKSCADLIRKFDLDPSKRIKELSRGMVAKVALTLALAHEPRLLVLDEPTDGLDAVVRKEFLESIVSVAADEGRTVLISSHLLQDVERVADRVALMEESRIGLVEDAGRAQGAVPRTEDHLRRLALRSLGEGGRRARPGGQAHGLRDARHPLAPQRAARVADGLREIRAGDARATPVETPRRTDRRARHDTGGNLRRAGREIRWRVHT